MELQNFRCSFLSQILLRPAPPASLLFKLLSFTAGQEEAFCQRTQF
jgi:hypothetical protein